MEGIRCMKDFDFNGKKVMVRTGYDVPVDDEGNVTDDTRITASLETIRYLLISGASKIIIIHHMGRPKEPCKKFSTAGVAKTLSTLLDEDVAHVPSWGEGGLPENKIVILENLRFNPAEKSKDPSKRDEFGKKLADLADVLVMEAYSNMHHPDQASMTSVLKHIPAVLGLAAEKQIKIIHDAVMEPKRPFVSIIGGVKAEKLGSVKEIIKRADKVLLGGALAFSVLNTFGKSMGDSKIDHEGLLDYENFLKTLKDNPRLVVPVDAVVADRFSPDAQSKVVSVDNIPDGWMALDIGPDTIGMYSVILEQAKTIIWNGPIGVFEFEKFSDGTKLVAKAVAESDAFSIIGGGDSEAAIEKTGYKDKVSYVSTGGGASLMMFEGKELPVLTAMKESKN